MQLAVPLYSPIREKPTSNPASNRDSLRPDTRTRVIVSFPKDNCLVRANHYYRRFLSFSFPFSPFRSFAARFRFRLAQLVPPPIILSQSRVIVDPRGLQMRCDRFDGKGGKAKEHVRPRPFTREGRLFALNPPFGRRFESVGTTFRRGSAPINHPRLRSTRIGQHFFFLSFFLPFLGEENTWRDRPRDSQSI